MGDDNQVINPGQVWQSKKSDRRILLTGKGINKFKEVYYLFSLLVDNGVCGSALTAASSSVIYENDLLDDFDLLQDINAKYPVK